MVNRHIDPQIKELALHLFDSGWDRSDICFILGISKSSLYRWKDIFERFGSVTKLPSPILGRPRILGLAAIQACQETFQQHPDTYLDELVWFLAVHHDIAISTSALQENLEKAGLTRKRLHKIALERDEALRADYRAAISNRNLFSGTGEEFVAVDESSKNEHDVARRYGRSLGGQPADFKDVFVRGTRYSLCAALSIDGYIAARVEEGSFTGLSFFEFIVDDVVPQMNAYPGPRSVLVLDNCRIHHLETLKETLNTLGILILYTPAYSPDLNPIEESFSKWKAYLRRNGALFRNAQDPIQILLDSCGCVTAKMAKGWFRHAGYILVE